MLTLLSAGEDVKDWDPHPLLVGVLNTTTTVKNGLTFSHKFKHQFPYFIPKLAQEK